jgi:hypothetical protein
MREADTVPMEENSPPTMRFPLPSTTIASTMSLTPWLPEFKLTQSASLKVGSIRTG